MAAIIGLIGLAALYLSPPGAMFPIILIVGSFAIMAAAVGASLDMPDVRRQIIGAGAAWFIGSTAALVARLLSGAS